MPLLDSNNQISKYTTCMCCGKLAGLFSHMLFLLKESCSCCNYPEKNSVLERLSRRSGYRQIKEIQRLDVLKQVHLLLTCHVVLDVMND